MNSVPAELTSTLEKFGQLHALKWWDELDESQREQLTTQLSAVDFETIHNVWNASKSDSQPEDTSGKSRADTARAPSAVVLQKAEDPTMGVQPGDTELGAKLLAEGKVAVITVAGGQGSRLGFDHPKGMFPIGPISDRTLFQIFAEQIEARKRRHGGDIPWLIMTSSATHEETVQFFEANDFFCLDRETVHFFQQGSMPAVDQETGKLLMSDKSSLCLSPDGHGGLVTALKSSGLLARMADAGVEHFFYHQVDNPTVIMCDPEFIGVHVARRSQLTTRVVRKTGPMEKMGVLVEINGRIEIIEYSELNEEQASRHDDNDQWIFWAGNTAIHAFSREFFEELTSDGCQLELHLASKKVPHIDGDGNAVSPTEPNANKFERFIFDALPLAKNALIVEGVREREFNPVKNAEGTDSPDSSRAALTSIGKAWLESAGQSVNDDAAVEISPLVALDDTELKQKLEAGDADAGSLVR